MDYVLKLVGAILIPSGDNLLRGSGFRSCAKSMTGDTSTLVIQFVFLAAIILAPWFHRRSKS